MVLLSSCAKTSIEYESGETTDNSTIEETVTTVTAENITESSYETSAEIIQADHSDIEQDDPHASWTDGEFIEVDGNINPRWWINFTSYIGDLPQDEVDEWSIFFFENDFNGKLFLDNLYITDPREVNLYSLYYGAWHSEITETQIEEATSDVYIYPLNEVNDNLYRIFGMTNDEFNEPLYVQHVYGQDCIVCTVYDDNGWNYSNFRGGYLNGDVYTLYSSINIVQFNVTDEGIRLIRSIPCDTQSSYGRSIYTLYEYYNENSFDDYDEFEMYFLYYEYYARHGVIFDDPVLKLYFEATTWYNGTIPEEEFDESVFTPVEAANVELLSQMIPWGMFEGSNNI